MSNQRSFWAALVGACLIALTPASGLSQSKGQQPSESEVAEATKRFIEGQKLYADNKFPDALIEFRASYLAVPSPNSHLYVARCLRELGRLVAAYEEYGQVLIEASERAASETKYGPTVKAAVDERNALRDKIGRVSVSVPADATGAVVHIGQDIVAGGRWAQEIAVEPGTVKVRVEAPGREPYERQVSVSSGEKKSVSATMPPGGNSDSSSSSSSSSGGPSTTTPSSSSSGGFRTAAIVSGAVGVVGMGVFGGLAYSSFADYRELRGTCSGACSPHQVEELESARDKSSASYVALGVGVLGLAGGAALFVTHLATRNSSSSSTGRSSPPPITAFVSPDPNAPGLIVAGHF